jgi:hypothetical protein
MDKKLLQADIAAKIATELAASQPQAATTSGGAR